MDNELHIARKVRDGQLPSPQKFGNMHLFAIRVTGTGTAFRRAHNEIVVREPDAFLTNDFLERCQGLPVVIEHPANNVLDSGEFAKRVVGAIMLPYVRDSEVWGIARIYDQQAAEAMRDLPLSTSPCVIISRASSYRTELESGKKVLIEGEPHLLDHLAIVSQGVWDKGEGPSGIEGRTDSMSDEENKTSEKEKQPLDKFLNKVDATISKFTDVANALGQRLDNIDKRLDALERNRDDRGDRRDHARRYDDDDEYVLEDRPGPEPSEARKVVADRNGEDGDDWRPDGSKLREAFADAQSRADNALAQWGGRAPAPLAGESFRRYRHRLLRPLQKYSQVYKDVDLTNFPEVAFGEAEKAIYADAAVAVERADLVPEGMLRMVTKTLPNGSKETRFVGHPSAWMNYFIPPRRALVRLNPKGMADIR